MLIYGFATPMGPESMLPYLPSHWQHHWIHLCLPGCQSQFLTLWAKTSSAYSFQTLPNISHTHTHTPQALAFVLAPSLLVLLTLLWPFLSLPGPANNHCLVSQGVFPHGWHSQQQPPSAHSAAEGLSRAALSGKRRQAHTTRDIFWTHSKQDLHIYNPLAAV